MDSKTAEIQDLVSRVTGNDNQEITERHLIITTLFNLVETHTGAQVKLDNGDEVESSAVQLWNWVVAKNMGNHISEEHNAKLRHTACKLLGLIGTCPLRSTTIQRQILMATKTARSWLACKEFDLCEEFLNIAQNSIAQIQSTGFLPTESQAWLEVQLKLFMINCVQAELAVKQGWYKKSSIFLLQCKDMLHSLPHETVYLSMLCYNFGIETFEQKRFEECVFWLRQSYDIGKMHPTYKANPSHQAKSLRFLAKVYMDWDAVKYSEEALHAVNVANAAEAHSEGPLLKVKILSRSKAPDTAILGVVEDLLKQDIPVIHALDVLRSLLHDNRESLCSSCLETLSKHMQHSLEFGQILLFKLEFLLYFGHESLAKQHVEECITGHYTDKALSDKVKKLFQAMIWEQAAKCYDATDYTAALQWYNYSVSLYSMGSKDGNLGRLHRNRSVCYQHLLQYEQATEAAKESQRCDPDSMNTNVTVFQVSLLTGNIQDGTELEQERELLKSVPEDATATEALSHMERISKSVQNWDSSLELNSTTELLGLAVQIALEHTQSDLAVKALEIYCSASSDIKKTLHALKCMVRLRITGNEEKEKQKKDMDILISYQQTALEKLQASDGVLTVEERDCDANWFKSIAWNLALDNQDCPENMQTLFMLSYHLSRLCIEDLRHLLAQKTCLVMAAAAALQLGREQTGDAQVAQLTQVLKHTEACWEVDTRLRSEVKEVGLPHRDPSSVLVRLYELEAHAKLCALEDGGIGRTRVASPQLEEALQALFELPGVEPSALESAAALLMDPPAYYLLLSKKALRFAFSLYVKRTPVNVEACSEILHSLIQASLPRGIMEDPDGDDEAWGYFQDALFLLADKQDAFPELQLLWLVTTSWNRGVAVLSYGRAPEVVERWCGLAMRLLMHLTSLRSSYQNKMTTLYAEILKRVEKAKKHEVKKK